MESSHELIFTPSIFNYFPCSRVLFSSLSFPCRLRHICHFKKQNETTYVITCNILSSAISSKRKNWMGKLDFLAVKVMCTTKTSNWHTILFSEMSCSE